MNLAKMTKTWHDPLFFVFRVLVGFMFFAHGAQKMFGWFGGTQQALGSLLGVAGLLELLVGLAILLGLWVRAAAVVGAIVMLVAYFYMHASAGWNPLVNGGELALLYFVSFLVLLEHGARKWSLETMLWKKERF